ncbi:hypothetical protein L1049_010053 [Liquidambar formosana]|uniref:Uncharacterized protein n=1 Tax=Liquidambar formosana TaxID=63359 RepID=A0AAP0N8K5_LIQFO
MSKKTATDMRWHKEKRIAEENVLRHPVDSIAWKEFDKEHDWFAQEPRNVRLGLASDGFNPFGNMSNSYSMWPVLLMPYNLPPWKCMKEPFFMMSILIPGPKSPGNDIDVYMRPLIDELKELWEDGVETYDASTKQNFQLHAAVLWTINDFPAYGNLSEWSTKGKLACPTCNKDTCFLLLKHGKKICYMDHRRYLPLEHSWRKRTIMFNGKQEHWLQPRDLSGDDVLEQLSFVKEVSFGKPPKKKKRKRSELELNWRKKSIFFQLPYWKTLKLRHNLDVIHIEKNICDNVLGTLMSIDGKTKDTVKAHIDLEAMGIRKELHLRRHGTKYEVPPACYTLSANERKGLYEWLKSVKFLHGYASNITRCVNATDGKISGMKSHDCHVFLQQLLLITVRGYLRKDVSTALVELSFFFKELCCRTLKVDVLERQEREIALILCKLEMIFPPAFFDVMVHLAIHLPHETKLGGPVQYRWMYPIERFLRTLKCYVRNKARPKGSIAEAYINNECLTFCSMYLSGVETRFNREERNYDGGQEQQPGELSVFSQNVRPLGSTVYSTLTLTDLAKAQCEHVEEIKRQSMNNVDKRHQDEFPKWFEKHMKMLRNQNSPKATNQLYSLACGPDSRVRRYSACIVNGFRFHIEAREKHRGTQNSGLVVKGEHQSEEVDFYGVLINIIALSYCGGNQVFLFKCDWWDIGNKKAGIRKDDHFMSVNKSRKCDTWQVVQKAQPRNSYDVPEVEEEDIEVDKVKGSMGTDYAYQLNESNENDRIVKYDDRELDPLHRDDVIPKYVDATVIEKSKEVQDSGDNAFIYDDETDEDDTFLDYCTDEEGSMGPAELSIPDTVGVNNAPSIIKKGRGKAVGNVLEKATRGGRRVPVTIPNGKFKPIGDWAAVFTSEVGVICRQWAPLIAKNWAEIKDEDKKVLYQHILDKFEIDLNRPNVKHTVDMMLKDRYKNWRHKLYKFYKEFPPEEASQHLLEDVKQNDWDHLCERFSSDKFQEKMKSLQSQPGPDGVPLTADEICDQVLRTKIPSSTRGQGLQLQLKEATQKAEEVEKRSEQLAERVEVQKKRDSNS